MKVRCRSFYISYNYIYYKYIYCIYSIAPFSGNVKIEYRNDYFLTFQPISCILMIQVSHLHISETTSTQQKCSAREQTGKPSTNLGGFPFVCITFIRF